MATSGSPLDIPAGLAGDIAPEAFAAAGHELIDWITRYLEGIEELPVLAGVAPGEIRHRLPASPPDEAEPLGRILGDVDSAIIPGITHWNHPGFLAYFAITGSGPGILGELLTAALNVNAMLWTTSPAATELEELALDWLRQMIGLEAGWFGMINDTASMSTLLALAAARASVPGLDIRERGMAGRADLPALRVYTSEHSHSSVDKAAMMLGLGHTNVVHIGVDAAFRMRADLLDRAIAEDRAAGRLPLAVVATIGTTSTTSIDPVPAIGATCRREGIWLHVDAAYGGVAAIVPEMRSVMAGVELADSVVVNPHKWLFTPIDCSALYTRRPDALRHAFSLVPEYLVTGSGDATNFMDYGVQLGHRFRALKLWMVIRAFGVKGLAARVRRHCELAREFESWVRAEQDWQVMAPVGFSLVCFRYAPRGMPDVDADTLNARVLSRVNAGGRVYLSHTKLGGRYTLRLAIGNIRTDRRHLESAWTALREAVAGLVRLETGQPE